LPSHGTQCGHDPSVEWVPITARSSPDRTIAAAWSSSHMFETAVLVYTQTAVPVARFTVAASERRRQDDGT